MYKIHEPGKSVRNERMEHTPQRRTERKQKMLLLQNETKIWPTK
jgi:hypothetical protein